MTEKQVKLNETIKLIIEHKKAYDLSFFMLSKRLNISESRLRQTLKLENQNKDLFIINELIILFLIDVPFDYLVSGMIKHKFYSFNIVKKGELVKTLYSAKSLYNYVQMLFINSQKSYVELCKSAGVNVKKLRQKELFNAYSDTNLTYSFFKNHYFLLCQKLLILKNLELNVSPSFLFIDETIDSSNF